jgi:hypothetical protein
VRKGHIWSVLRRSAARPNRCLHSGVFALLRDIAPSLLSDLIRAAVSTRRQRFIIHSIGTHVQIPVPPFPTQLNDISTHLPLLDQWAVDECGHSDNGFLVADAIRNGSALAISDGSYKNKRGTYKNKRGTSAFLLHGPSKEQGRILGVNHTPGNPSDQTLSIICQIHPISSGAV